MQEIKRRKLNGDFKNHNKLGQKNNLSKYFSSSSQNQNSQKQSNSSCSITSQDIFRQADELKESFQKVLEES